jgi:phosphonopyruvate decarboxylase
MLSPGDFYQSLLSAGINFFTGVPDSLLKDFCAYVADRAENGADLVAANEGAAVALATGHYLATGRSALVYMQNSGLGNAVNPLTSLADPEVYSIPMLLLIGWRGESGRPDEPQHVKQGKITREMLDCLGIPNEVLPDSLPAARELIGRAVDHFKEKEAPFAIVVSAGTFDKYEKRELPPVPWELSREAAIQALAANLDKSDIIVATTGKSSRELFEYRAASGGSHSGDFLTVGSMGHASQIAMAIALNRPNRPVFCLDGDGAAIMHMGSLAVIGTKAPKNFKHVVVNNGAHDSVGGQPTAGHAIDLIAIADACRYRSTARVHKGMDLPNAIDRLREQEGPAFLEILAHTGSRDDLGRPTIAPVENKKIFMRNVSE